MKVSILGSIGFLLALIIVTGCSSPAKDTSGTVPASKDNPDITGWEPIERVHFTKGILLTVSGASGFINKMSLKAETNIASDNDPVDIPDYPFRVDQEIDFTLYKIIDQSQIDLLKGTTVIIDSVRGSIPSTGKNILLANIICYEDNGIYYDLNKKPIDYTFSRYVSLQDGKLEIRKQPSSE